MTEQDKQIEKLNIEPIYIEKEQKTIRCKVVEEFSDNAPIYARRIDGSIQTDDSEYVEDLEEQLIDAIENGEFLTVLIKDGRIVKILSPTL